MERKPDAEKIRTHLENLAAKYQSDTSKKLWPKFLFRVENITSAADILNTGVLYSREAAIQHSISCRDSACQDILDQTAERWKKHVRLHFRPATAYHLATEGIRPAAEIINKAHCPVPVLFLFDSNEILSRESTLFSDGNLRADMVKTGSDYDFFKTIPFDSVYKYYRKSERDYKQTKIRNQAEIMVPLKLELDPLRYLICRSQPEKETLLALLSPESFSLWRNRIGLRSDWFRHFYKYVQHVRIEDKKIHFNMGSGMNADYMVQVKVQDCDTGQRYASPLENKTLGEKIVFNTASVHANNYEIELLIDSHLAYKKIIITDDFPF